MVEKVKTNVFRGYGKTTNVRNNNMPLTSAKLKEIAEYYANFRTDKNHTQPDSVDIDICKIFGYEKTTDNYKNTNFDTPISEHHFRVKVIDRELEKKHK